jgi:glycosyltransferase involved in cell wall biosynthesis
MESYKIGILMPIYNGSEFFDDSFQSIVNQEYSNWHLFIGINGHIKDSIIYNTIKDKISDYKEKYKIDIYDFGEESNKSKTLNSMVQLIKTQNNDIKYVALLDVDDVWHKEKLIEQIHYIKDGYDVVGSNCVYFGDKNNIIPPIPIGDFSKNYDFTKSNPVINSSVIININLAQWNINNTVGTEDYELWIQLKKKGGIKFYNLPNILVKHRIHKKSAFNNTNNNFISQIF